MKKNPCWTGEHRTIRPKGIMVHSTAEPGKRAKEWYDEWNRSVADGGKEVSVHAFVDDKDIYEYLPWERRAWHCGRAYTGGPTCNDTHISIEMCEPLSIVYDDEHKKIVSYDPADPENKRYFANALKNMVDLCAYLVEKFDIKIENVICHAEGFRQGKASNHADVEHWWPLHGVTMDMFRQMVDDAVQGKPVTYEFNGEGKFVKY